MSKLVRRRAKITALGTYVPPRLLTNEDLEKMVETSHDWIMERTGIRERHIVDKGVSTSDLAAEAARKALASRGVPATDLEAIIVATVTPDMLFPSTACLVEDKLGATAPGASTSPPPVRPLYLPCRLGRSSSQPALTRR